MIDGSRIPLRNEHDIAAIEAQPWPAPGAPASAYQALQAAALRWPHKQALRFFIDGSCHDAQRIPLRARLRGLAAHLRYGSPVARPYETQSFEQLAAQVSRTARLLQQHGVGRGDVVSLLLPNLPETLTCLWAAQTVAIANPVNPLLEPGIIEAILNKAGTRVLVTLGNLPGSDIWQKVQRLRHRVPSLQTVIVLRGSCPADCVPYRSAVAGHSAAPLPAADWPEPGAVASLFHTGGTTGAPRLVRGSHANLVANAQMLIAASPLQSDDVGLIALPMFHVNAAVNCLIGLLLGMTSVVAGPAGFRTPQVRENFFRILAGHRISYFSAVPTMFSALLQLPRPTEDLRCVRFAISAAAPLPVEVAQRFSAATGIRIVEGYGQTEATVASCLNPIQGEAKPGSVGLRLPHCRLQVAQLSGQRVLRQCAPGEIGALLVAGPHVSLGCVDPAHDQALWVTDAQGQRWLNSGDLARIDADGHVWLTGRAKELIIRGGHNIDPRLIEDALQRHPGVALAAAVGRPDALAGELPVVYVTLAAGAVCTPDTLLLHAQQHIPERAAWPKAVVVVDALPLTAIGKVFKPALVQREMAAAVLQALAQRPPGVLEVAAQCQAHPEFGLCTDVRLLLAPRASRLDAERWVADALAAYALRYRLQLVQAAAEAADAAGAERLSEPAGS